MQYRPASALSVSCGEVPAEAVMTRLRLQPEPSARGTPRPMPIDTVVGGPALINVIRISPSSLTRNDFVETPPTATLLENDSVLGALSTTGTGCGLSGLSTLLQPGSATSAIAANSTAARA